VARAFWRRAEPARVSVAVPLYNHAAFIAEAVESILAQGALVKEVVVLDDGSTDDSAAVMERLARRDERIRFARQANAGAHAAINAALECCSGEILAILNSDDAYVPGRLSALAEALDADEGADIAASGIVFMDGEGAPISNAWYDEARAVHRAGTALGVALLNGNFLMTTSNLVFRRAALRAVGAFAALRYAHDLDWLLRALALGRRIVVLDKSLLRYRQHGRNTINEDHGRVRAEWAMAAAAYLTLLWDRPGAPAVDWDHATAAATVLRQHALDRAVLPCMAYLRRHGALPLDRAPLLTDKAFRDRVRGWV
jgi:glycosyltransferase involved in cell wall biosynthesis